MSRPPPLPELSDCFQPFSLLSSSEHSSQPGSISLTIAQHYYYLIQYHTLNLPMLKSKFLDSLLVEKDQNLRHSLFPFSSDQVQQQVFSHLLRSPSSVSSMQRQLHPKHTGPRHFQRYDVSPEPEFRIDQLLVRYKDVSADPRPRSKSSKERIIEAWSSILGLLWMKSVIPRDSWGLFAWNCLLMLVLVFQLFEVPVAVFLTRAVFDDQFHTVAGLIINWLSVAVLFIQMFLVRPNVQFRQVGYLISNRRQTILNYMGWQLGLDFTCLAILIIYCSAYQHRLVYLKVGFYLSIWSLAWVDGLIWQRLQATGYPFGLYRLLRLIFMEMMVVIWLSAVFFYIDYRQYQDFAATQPPSLNPTNWLTNVECTYQVINATTYPTNLITTYPDGWYVWLDYAVYWALQTISTVGYGDMTPRNPASVAFTNVSILVMMVFFVIFINGALEIIAQLHSAQHQQRQQLRKQLILLTEATKEKVSKISKKYHQNETDVERQLKGMSKVGEQVRGYIAEADGGTGQDQIGQLLNEVLTPELRDKLFLSYRELFFRRVGLFAELANSNPAFAYIYEALIFQIKERNMGRGERVYERGMQKDNQLHLLLTGTLKLIYPASRFERTLTTQDPSSNFLNFGVRQFFTRESYDHEAVTQSYCKVQTLDYGSLIDALKLYPNFHYRFCQLRDQLILGSGQHLTGEDCWECGSKKHHLLSCPRCLFNVRFHMSPKKPEPVSSLFQARNGYYVRDNVRSIRLRGKKIAREQILTVQTVHNYTDYYGVGNIAQLEGEE